MPTLRIDREQPEPRPRSWDIAEAPSTDELQELVREVAANGSADLRVLFLSEGAGSDIAWSYFPVTEAYENHGYLIFAGIQQGGGGVRAEPFVGYIRMNEDPAEKNTGQITFNPSSGRLIGHF